MHVIQRGLALDDPMLKRVGLLAGAILVAVALTGAMASPAPANAQVGVFLAGEESEEESEQPRLEAESYPVDLVGESDTAHVFGFGEIGSYECPWAEFSGAYFEGLPSATSELALWTFYPYFECTGLGIATITANGCEDIVTIDNSGPPYVGDFGMECPEGQSYELHSQSGCSIAIPAQSGIGTVSYENVGEGSESAVQVEFDVSEMKYSIVGHFLCPKGEYEDGTYTGTMTLRGYGTE